MKIYRTTWDPGLGPFRIKVVQRKAKDGSALTEVWMPRMSDPYWVVLDHDLEIEISSISVRIAKVEAARVYENL